MSNAPPTVPDPQVRRLSADAFAEVEINLPAAAGLVHCPTDHLRYLRRLGLGPRFRATETGQLRVSLGELARWSAFMCSGPSRDEETKEMHHAADHPLKVNIFNDAND